MALGHPLGGAKELSSTMDWRNLASSEMTGTGAKLMTTLVHELRRRQARNALKHQRMTDSRKIES